MSEVRRIRAQLRATFDGEAWHGPPLWSILESVEPRQACEHPIPDAHSIWELVLHITYWRSVVLEALAGRSIEKHKPDTPEDWRIPSQPTEEAWRKALEDLKRSQDELLEALAAFDDDRLREVVSGRDYPFYVLLHGLIHHDLYHAGQVALLKKT